MKKNLEFYALCKPLQKTESQKKKIKNFRPNLDKNLNLASYEIAIATSFDEITKSQKILF